MVVGVMLAAGLILGAQAFVVGSSRTIFQMTADGHMPRQFAVVNRRGVPFGSLLWDALIVLTLLLIFGTNVVNVVAAANFGYLVVFVLMPIAYLVRRRRLRRLAAGTELTLPRMFETVAITLAVVNLILLVVGGAQWGIMVGLTGVIVIALAIPLSLLSQWQRRRLRAAAAPEQTPSATQD
jgi:amino acid transporter